MQPDSYRRTSDQLARREPHGSLYDKIAEARSRREVALRRDKIDGAPDKRSGTKADAAFQRYLMSKSADSPETMEVKTASRARPAAKMSAQASTSLFPPGAPSTRAPATTMEELQERAADTLTAPEAAPTASDAPEEETAKASRSFVRTLALPLLFGIAIGLVFLFV